MSIYTQFDTINKLISPVNGYSCRVISKQNIKQFGFNSIEDLHSEYPNFPLICEDFRNLKILKRKSKKYTEAIETRKEKNKEAREIEKLDYEKNPFLCKKCKSTKSYQKRNNEFCSRECANSHTHSEETKDKIRKAQIANPSGFMAFDESTMAKMYEKQRSSRKIVYCKSCSSSFEILESDNRIYCSRKCNPKVGGYRKGSGRSIGGYYKGIYCHSTYELVWVMFNLSNGIKFEDFKGFIEYVSDGKRHKYYPDFVQGDKVIEIKGYHTKIVDIKVAAAILEGYNIDILYKDDLEKHFKWFSETYPNSDLKNMYEIRVP